MTDSVPPRRGPGRRRSEASRLAVLRATRELLDDVGYERLTIGGIATRAGVGKDTIYRWWPSKAMIVAESVLDPDDEAFFTDEPGDTGEFATDLAAWLRRRAIDYADPTSAARIRAVTAAATEDEETATLIYERFAQPQQRAIVDRLERAAAAGTLVAGADFVAVADALLGAQFYWLIARRPDVEIETVCRLLDVLLRGLRPAD